MYPLSLIKDGEDHRFFRASAEFFIVLRRTWSSEKRRVSTTATSNRALIFLGICLGGGSFLRSAGCPGRQKQVHRESRRRCFRAEVHVQSVRRLTMMVRFEGRTDKADSDLALDLLRGITDQGEKHLASEGTGKLGFRLREKGRRWWR